MIARFDANSEIGQPQVERVVGRPVSTVFPNNYQVALGAMNNGRPLALDNHTRLAAAFIDFARQLAGIRAEPAERNKPSACSRFSAADRHRTPLSRSCVGVAVEVTRFLRAAGEGRDHETLRLMSSGRRASRSNRIAPLE